MMRNYSLLGCLIEMPRCSGYLALDRGSELAVSVGRGDAAFIYRLAQWLDSGTYPCNVGDFRCDIRDDDATSNFSSLFLSSYIQY